MKVSLNWVKEYTNVNLPVDELVAKIGAQLGEVETVSHIGKHYQGIFIVEVITCVKHPDADKLSLCTVDDGGKVESVERDKNGYVQVVCGAPNVRAGMLAVWLPPGTTVPASINKEPLVLDAREIRGHKSNGMLASASELGISEDHTGILDIEPESIMTKAAAGEVAHTDAQSTYKSEPTVKPGDDFAAVYKLDDYIIDIENKMFTHRPDLFGILGIAREIAGITGQYFKSPSWYASEKLSGEDARDKQLLELRNELPELVPRFMAQIFQNVEIKPSTLRMQTFLSRVGIRPINNIVDITNYVMYLTGQPLHAYDYDKLKALDGKDHATIVVRYPTPGEKLTLLGGKAVTPRAEAIMIASDSKLIGIGGVMGGADTEVDANTKNIVLECATFDMYSIRRTSMEHGLFTDAVTRFNKGQSPLQNDRVLALARDEIIHHSGGLPAITIYDQRFNVVEPPTISLRPSFVNERLGLRLTAAEMTTLLQNVEFNVAEEAGELLVMAPFWRTDIEIPEDIVEEIGRLYGYDHLPKVLPQRDLTPAPKNGMFELKNQIRTLLGSSGANEALTYSFVHGNLLDKVGQNKEQAYQLSNALSPELQYCRLSVLPSLLDKVHANIRSDYLRISDEIEFALFEIGKAHIKSVMDPQEPNIPDDMDRIALVFAADDKTAVKKYSGAAYFQARTYLDALLNELGIDYTITTVKDAGNDEAKTAVSPFEPSRLGAVVCDKRVLGYIGEFKSSVRRNLKLPVFTAGFELDLRDISSKANGQSTYRELPRFPKVVQDISLRVPATLSYGELYIALCDAAESSKPDHISYGLFPLDIFQKSNEQTGKQMTFRLWMAHYERTLTATEVNTFLDGLAAVAKEKFGADRI